MNILSGAYSGAGPDPNRYIVNYINNVGYGAIVQQAGGRVHVDLKPQKAVAVSLPNEEAVQVLRSNPNVGYVEVDPMRFLLSAGSRRGTRVRAGEASVRDSQGLQETSPYGIAMVQADQLAYNVADAKKVCVIDTGYDSGHPDLPSASVTFGVDIGLGPADEDASGHGTHVAGTIAAIGGNDLGVRGVIGDPAVQLHIVRVFDENLNIFASSVVEALNDCVANGADVVNLSLGCSSERLRDCYSRTEDRAFAEADAVHGVLSVAAAGNDGNSALTFPASYDSVVSVAAVDRTRTHADISQTNEQVELSGPGVLVLSTEPRGKGVLASFSVKGAGSFEAIPLSGTVTGSIGGSLFRCDAVDGIGSVGDCEGASGKICLIERGTIPFFQKGQECARAGGIAAVIFNNDSAFRGGKLDEDVTIPVVLISQQDGATVVGLVGRTAHLDVVPGDYGLKSGTSMACPHVAGVAALVWSNHPSCSNYEIRVALRETAVDLGDVGDDDLHGYGLIQAKAASDYLAANGCTGTAAPGGGSGGPCRNGQCDAGCVISGDRCEANSDCCSGRCRGSRNKTCQ